MAIPRALGVTLNDSGLISSGAFKESIFAANRVDELLVFDNSNAARNKSAVATYFYRNNIWRKVGDGVDHGNDVLFQPGTGVIIRAGPDNASSVWLNDTTY